MPIRCGGAVARCGRKAGGRGSFAAATGLFVRLKFLPTAKSRCYPTGARVDRGACREERLAHREKLPSRAATARSSECLRNSAPVCGQANELRLKLPGAVAGDPRKAFRGGRTKRGQ